MKDEEEKTDGRRNLVLKCNIPPCNARRESVGALYSAVSGLLAITSRSLPSTSLSYATAPAVV